MTDQKLSDASVALLRAALVYTLEAADHADHGRLDQALQCEEVAEQLRRKARSIPPDHPANRTVGSGRNIRFV